MVTPREAQLGVLRLYKRCLRTANRIPNPEQRMIYQFYVRDGFRRKRNLPGESREALIAIRNAEEQLERMNYYLSVREGGDSAMKRVPQKPVADSRKTELSVSAAKEESNRNEMQKENQVKEDARHRIVEDWLRSSLPDLHANDLSSYATHLVNDGFDSVDMLETELLAEDLDFMKKAHKRAIVRRKLVSTRTQNT